MTASPFATGTSAPARLLDRARGALRAWSAGPAAAARRERAQQRNQARADRALRLAVARFGAQPAGRAATTLHHGGWGA